MRAAAYASLVAGSVAAAGGCGSHPAPAVLGSLVPPDAGRGDDADIVPSGGSDAATFIGSIPSSDDPLTCAAAAASKSYVGCDYWPTVTANNVWSIFDFAVVVANAGAQTAQLTVTGPNGLQREDSVAPGAVAKIYLPWVAALKGPDADECGNSMPVTASTLQRGGAYHLVSSAPVIVTQFNALEYLGSGGPPGKDWASCPGNSTCSDMSSPSYDYMIGCFSFSNDSSLLLPSTALTGNARVIAYPGETQRGNVKTVPYMASTLSITAVKDATHVKVLVSKSADVVVGTGVAATAAGGELDLTLDAGDVAQLVTDLGDTYDFSGTLVQADQPVQVISGAPCDEVSEGTPACDHLEQSVFPAETLGKHYFVTVPTSPGGRLVGHVVRFAGNVNGTTLAYLPRNPGNCPTTLDAGQVADCGIVSSDFEVLGNNEFVVASFQLGGSLIDPTTGLGDPSQTLFASVEQYRVKYVFLAPDDYVENYADVVEPSGTRVWLDGDEVAGTVTPIASGYETRRIALDSSNGGAHVLEATHPSGVQVMGYGEYTSYQYPGGLNLAVIAPPPNTQ
jgi:hypothetical protein